MKKTAFQMEYDWMAKMMRDPDCKSTDWCAFGIGAIKTICEYVGKDAIDKIQGVIRALDDFNEKVCR
ncbi:MAG: hypothetical protein IKN81_09325 [Oscillospiraceae bacterium]|nr:hypothetical protein [Oscillospiraceae bacterium]